MDQQAKGNNMLSALKKAGMLMDGTGGNVMIQTWSIKVKGKALINNF